MNINTLLNKKTWKGEEVGKALIASLIHDIEKSGSKDWQPLFPQAEFNRMVDSLNTEAQIGKYLVYEKIYSAVINSYNRCQALQQQYLHGYYRMLGELERIYQANNNMKVAEQYPLIMTEEQYQRIAEAVRKELAGRKDSFTDILFEYLQYCIDRPEEAPASILEALEACKKETADNKRMLDAYKAEGHGDWHMILPDGTDNTKVSQEEWEQALKRTWAAGKANPEAAENVDEIIAVTNLKNRVKAIAAMYAGEDALGAYYEEVTGEPYDGDISDLMEAAEEVLNTRDTADFIISERAEKLCRTEYIEQPVSKYDLLTADGMTAYYSGRADEDQLTEEEQLKEFMADYPKLYKALQAETKTLLGITGKSKGKKYYTWGELAEKGLLDYAVLSTPTDWDIIDYYKRQTKKKKGRISRAEYNGLAILSSGSSYNIDKSTGDYREPAQVYADLSCLDDITIEDAEILDQCQDMLIIPAYRNMLAFNKLIEILAELYNVPDLKRAEIDLTPFIEKAKCYNVLLYFLYEGISGTPEEKHQRRKNLQDSFRTIDLDALAIPEARADAIKERLAGLKLTRAAAMEIKKFDQFMDELIHDEAEGVDA